MKNGRKAVSLGARALRRWIEKAGEGSVDLGAIRFGARAGLHRVHVYNLISGDRLPSLGTAVAIERVAKIPPRAWLQP